MILSDEEIKDTLMPRKDLAQSHLEANTRIRELEEILHAFLRAPSVGSNGPGSSTIVVQEYHLRAARAALAAADNTIRDCKKPLSWKPGKFAVKLE